MQSTSVTVPALMEDPLGGVLRAIASVRRHRYVDDAHLAANWPSILDAVKRISLNKITDQSWWDACVAAYFRGEGGSR